MAIRGDVPANGGDTQYLVSKFLRYCGRFFVPTLKSGVNLLIKKFGWRQPRVIEKLRAEFFDNPRFDFWTKQEVEGFQVLDCAEFGTLENSGELPVHTCIDFGGQ